MFKTKVKRNVEIVNEIRRNIDIEMDLANKALDRYNDTLKEDDLREYYFHKGSFSMCSKLLLEIDKM